MMMMMMMMIFEQKPINNVGGKGAWAYAGTAQNF